MVLLPNIFYIVYNLILENKIDFFNIEDLFFLIRITLLYCCLQFIHIMNIYYIYHLIVTLLSTIIRL
jgi:hypothetical protein